NVLQCNEVLRDTAFGDVEYHAFRGIERLAGGCAFVEAERGDPAAGTDQLSLGGGLLDEVAVVLDVGRSRDPTLELCEKHLATDAFQDQHLLEFGCEREQVDWVASVV